MTTLYYLMPNSATADQLFEDQMEKYKTALNSKDDLDRVIWLTAFKEWMDYSSAGATGEFSDAMYMGILYGHILPDWD